MVVIGRVLEISQFKYERKIGVMQLLKSMKNNNNIPQNGFMSIEIIVAHL